MFLTLSGRSFIKIQYNSFPLFPVACPFRIATHYNITTRHNSADSVPTSNLVCIEEVAIRTTFCVTGIIYYTRNFVIDIQCSRYKLPPTNVLNELYVKITLLRPNQRKF